MTKKICRAPLNIWKLNNVLLNNLWEEEITGEIRKYLKPNENEPTPHENQWDPVKPVLRGRFLAVNAYLKKKSEINNLTLYRKELQKEQT